MRSTAHVVREVRVEHLRTVSVDSLFTELKDLFVTFHLDFLTCALLDLIITHRWLAGLFGIAGSHG